MRSHLLVGTLTALATLTTASAADAAFPGRNGRLALGSPLGCNDSRRVATVRPDGTGLRILGDMSCPDDGSLIAAWDDAPEWSPDGRVIAFAELAPGGGGPAFATMRPDGSDRRRLPLLTDFEILEGPSFAPDGRRLVYTRLTYADPRALPEIWTSGIDGTANEFVRHGSTPRWSPDGRAIAYADPHRGTWLMSARTGRRIRRVAGVTAGSLDWAPDGKSLVLTARQPHDVWMVKRGGGGPARRVTRAPRPQPPVTPSSTFTRFDQAVWSPDGRRIAVARTRIRNEQVRRDVLSMNMWGRDRRLIWTAPPRTEETDVGGPNLSWQPLP